MRPLFLFYILVFYVLLQFSWWAYLLVELNTETYRHRIEVLELKHSDAKEFTRQKSELGKWLQKKWLMIAGEGFVFAVVLIAGIQLIRRSFKKEFELARQQRNFLLSVTHEFKSPLAAIKLGLQTLDKHSLDKDRQHEILTKAIHETNRINELVENALTAAQIENHSFRINTEELNLSELISSVVESSQDLYQKNICIESSIQPDIYFKGDPLALQSAIMNLIDNAQKYAPRNSTVWVELAEREHHIIITVKDNGPGIPKHERKKVFEKFYRIGNEDTRSAKGTGLGLFIAQHVALLHQGKIFVKDNVPEGAVFEMILKK